VTDPNKEYQQVIKEIAKWRKAHPGQELPLWLRMKLDAVAEKQAELQKDR